MLRIFSHLLAVSNCFLFVCLKIYSLRPNGLWSFWGIRILNIQNHTQIFWHKVSMHQNNTNENWNCHFMCSWASSTTMSQFNNQYFNKNILFTLTVVSVNIPKHNRTRQKKKEKKSKLLCCPRAKFMKSWVSRSETHFFLSTQKFKIYKNLGQLVGKRFLLNYLKVQNLSAFPTNFLKKHPILAKLGAYLAASFLF